MILYDRAPLTGVTRTRDGYLVAEVPVARPGVYAYTGDELGKPEMKVVRVYRPESVVFDKASLAGYANKPVTIGHPDKLVSKDNHKALAVGHLGEEVLRDGDKIRVPMMVTDGVAIKAIEGGARELSPGYTGEIEFTDGFAPDGQAYDAIQKSIEINHLAIVPKARGGSDLKIGDANKGGSVMADMTQIQRDGLSVSVPSSAAQIINKAFADADTAMSDMKKKYADMEKELETAKGAIKAKDKELEDMKSEKQKMSDGLDAAADARSALKEAATKFLGDGFAFDGKSNLDIQRAVVEKTLGDEAKNMSDGAVEGAYAVIKSNPPKTDPMRTAIGDAKTVQGDAWVGIITEAK